MPRIPKDKATPQFHQAVGIFQTDLNLACDALTERLVIEGWTEDQVKVLVAQLLRGIELKDSQGLPVELSQE